MAQPQVHVDEQTRIGTAEDLLGLPVAPMTWTLAPSEKAVKAAQALADQVASSKSPAEIEAALIRILEELPVADRYAAQDVFPSIIAQTTANVDKEAAKLAVQNAVAKINAQQAQTAAEEFQQIIIDRIVAQAHAVYGAAYFEEIASLSFKSADGVELKVSAAEVAVDFETLPEAELANKYANVKRNTGTKFQGVSEHEAELIKAINPDAAPIKKADAAASEETIEVGIATIDYKVAKMLQQNPGPGNALSAYIHDPRYGAMAVLEAILNQRALQVIDIYEGSVLSSNDALQLLANVDQRNFKVVAGTVSSRFADESTSYDPKAAQEQAEFILGQIQTGLQKAALDISAIAAVLNQRQETSSIVADDREIGQDNAAQKPLTPRVPWTAKVDQPESQLGTAVSKG
ncbi:MAG: hypothetical protein J0L97_10730 [Alphaproteobacteria bacterium]|nr:hypothetical protein [Alphaproteobacteria bacterium]